MLRFPPRRILVAVDMTEASRLAFRSARLISKRFGSVLEAVYCDAPLPSEISIYGDFAADPEHSPRLKAALTRRFKHAHALHIRAGDPEKVILSVARECRPDLLVVGTHGRKGLSLTFLGSVAEAVLSHSSVPVLVVRGEAKSVRRVLAPIGGDEEAQRGLAAAGIVAKAYGAHLDVLHVVTDPLFGANPRKLLMTQVDVLPEDVKRATSPSSAVRLGDPIEEILSEADGKDLLVVVARPKSPLKDLLLGTTAQRLARHAKIPLLVIPSMR
jgi:nucleotide-binding universal stress UspA family protein